jgi:hypothetical protein
VRKSCRECNYHTFKSFLLLCISENSAQERNLWVYTHEKDLLYFLEEDNKINRNIEEESDVKKQNCLSLYNSEETKEYYKMKKNQLIDQYDEEALLLQIPQDGTEVGAFDRLVITLYTEKVPYFLRQDNQTKEEIKIKNLMEYKSSVNPIV